MNKYTILSICLFALVMTACSDEDKLGPSIIIDSNEEQTPFDIWLVNNYTNPYNMEFHYKWNDIDSDVKFDYTPARIDKSIMVARILKYMWLDVISESAGMAFTRGYTPRVISLVGTAKHTSSTITLAYATSGMKITINKVNDTPDNPTVSWLTDNWLKTIFHENSHIWNQKKALPEVWASISSAYYLGGTWSETANSLDMAYKRGFVSRYARQNEAEDFAETLSIYIVRSIYGVEDDTWAEILEKAKPDPNSEATVQGVDGSAIILYKLSVIKEYMSTVWGVDLEDLRETFERHATVFGTMDLTTI
ncbi:MAG: putative zinc-binding metallopeptidase, partial [Mediterranea sp.]|nr:putative zinc-binding metallopeptidase [Mediterranea sp.]